MKNFIPTKFLSDYVTEILYCRYNKTGIEELALFALQRSVLDGKPQKCLMVHKSSVSAAPGLIYG